MSVFDSTSATDLCAVEPNELVRRAQGGCAESFAELSRRFRPRLVRLIERRLDGRAADAEDVVQDAFVRAYQHLDRFDPGRQFSTWLYTIAIRLAQDHERGRRRRLQRVKCDAETCATAESRATETTVVWGEEAGNMWRLAKRVLSDAQFTAMWLRYGESLSTAEVAKQMQRTRISVRVLLHRARARLVAAMPSFECGGPAEQVASRGAG